MSLSQRGRPSRRFLLIGIASLSACSVGGPSGAVRTPEDELSIRARDLQRSMLKAAAAGFLGAGGVYVIAGPRGGGLGIGVIGAIPITFAAGTYVGFLASQYDSDSQRRARLRADAELTQAEATATVRTLDVVVRRQQARVAAASASGSQREIEEARRLGEVARSDALLAAGGVNKRLAELDQANLRFPSRGTDAEYQQTRAQIVSARAELFELAQAMPVSSGVVQGRSQGEVPPPQTVARDRIAHPVCPSASPGDRPPFLHCSSRR